MHLLKVKEHDIQKEEEVFKAEGKIVDPVIPMMAEFTSIYPEHVKRFKIEYPLPDELLTVMPALHKIDLDLHKPNPKKIELENFEKLLPIWEFFNNFSDFLQLPKFKIEVLEAALRWEG